MELIPYITAMILLLIGFIIICKNKYKLIAAVTCILPALGITIDTFVIGNLTVFRMIATIFYACLLIYAVSHNIKERRL